MITAWFRHEWRLLLRSPRLSLLLLATLTLLGVSTWWSAATDRRQTEAQAQAAAQSRADWLGQGAVHPHRMAHFGDFVFRPNGPLSRFDAGIQATTGRVLRVEAHRQNTPFHAPTRAAGPLGSGGRFDPAFLLQVLGPLLLILLGGTAFAAEDKSGRLRWLLGQGASGWPIVLGRVAMLWSVGLAQLAVVCLGFLVADGGELAASHASRLLGMIGLYAVFYAVVAVAIVGVGLVARTGGAALVILLVAWVLGTAVLPRATASLATELAPLPTRDAFDSAMQKARAEGLDGHNPRDERMAQIDRKVLEEYGVSDVKDLPIDIGGIRMQADEEFGHKVWDEHYGRIRAIFAKQGRIAERMALLNPFQLVRSLSTTLAGTDLLHELRFLHDVEHYRRHLIGALNHEHAHGGEPGQRGRTAPAEFFAGLDSYEHRHMPLVDALRARTVEIVGLLAWLVLGILGLAYGVRRFEAGGAS